MKRTTRRAKNSFSWFGNLLSDEGLHAGNDLGLGRSGGGGGKPSRGGGRSNWLCTGDGSSGLEVGGGMRTLNVDDAVSESIVDDWIT